VEKALAIFIRDQQSNYDRVKGRSPEVLKELAELSWMGLFEKFEEKLSKLSPLFSETKLAAAPLPPQTNEKNWRFALERFVSQNPGHQFQIIVDFRGYRGRAKSPFSFRTDIRLVLSDFDYKILHASRVLAKKLYSEPILSDEADILSAELLKALFEQVKQQSQTE
jgi:hypothetical protein